jgi:N-acetylneuraminate synthase
MKEGEVFTNENIRIIRPGLGESPRHFDMFLGKKINQPVIKGTALTFDLIG